MERSPALWVLKHKIKNEAGVQLDFSKRKFLWQMYNDLSPLQVLLKPPQIGATVMNTVKSLYVARNPANIPNLGKQIIYTLPTQSDVQDMVGGSFNRIIAQNDILKEWVKDHDTIEQKTVGNSIIFYRGCVDEQTEVLTENGWCKLGEVHIGDRIPSLNTVTNTVEMDTVLNLSVFQVPEEQMVRIHSRQVDQLVTLDHRCVVSKRTFSGKKSPLRIVRAHELVGKNTAYIPMSYKEFSMPYENAGNIAFYRILGWVIGDGSYWTKRDRYTSKKGEKIAESKKVCIIQSKFCEQLELHLKQAELGFYKKRHNNTCWRYELNSKASTAIRKFIPHKQLTYNLVFNATPFELKALYEGLMFSDGNNYANTRFYQNNSETVDAFQAMLVLLGKTSSNVSKRKNRTVSIKTTDYAQVKATIVPYKGKAWCPTTKNGTIFIRRNGIVSVTGQTFTNKQAMMVSSGLNIHDEVDASNSEVITQYETRLQAQEDGGWRWYFSHPSLTGHGVDVYWQQSDKKEWFITCPHCKHEHVLQWPHSIDLEKQEYICVQCGKHIPDEARINGRWVATSEGPFSGYHVSQLMLHNKTAKNIIDAFNDPLKTKQYFYNYVLGLPFASSEDKIDPSVVLKNCVDEVNSQESRVVIGMDTGHGIHFVLMNQEGVFYYGNEKEITADKNPYNYIEHLLKRFPKSIVVSDQGGDLIGVRQLQAKYPGRVFLCYYQKDRKTKEIVRWGDNDEYGKVSVDRNRHITLMVEQMRDIGRWRLQGTTDEWSEFASHWGNIYREKIQSSQTPNKDDRTLYGTEFVWKRNGPDHWVHAAGYALIGLQRFAKNGAIIVDNNRPTVPTGQIITPEGVSIMRAEKTNNLL